MDTVWIILIVVAIIIIVGIVLGIVFVTTTHPGPTPNPNPPNQRPSPVQNLTFSLLSQSSTNNYNIAWDKPLSGTPVFYTYKIYPTSSPDTVLLTNNTTNLAVVIPSTYFNPNTSYTASVVACASADVCSTEQIAALNVNPVPRILSIAPNASASPINPVFTYTADMPLTGALSSVTLSNSSTTRRYASPCSIIGSTATCASNLSTIHPRRDPTATLLYNSPPSGSRSVLNVRPIQSSGLTGTPNWTYNTTTKQIVSSIPGSYMAAVPTPPTGSQVYMVSNTLSNSIPPLLLDYNESTGVFSTPDRSMVLTSPTTNNGYGVVTLSPYPQTIQSQHQWTIETPLTGATTITSGGIVFNQNGPSPAKEQDFPYA